MAYSRRVAAGAYYGENAIPEAWRARVARFDLILQLADRLHALALGTPV